MITLNGAVKSIILVIFCKVRKLLFKNSMILCSVPKGPVLALLSFLIYVNDMLLVVKYLHDDYVCLVLKEDLIIV